MTDSESERPPPLPRPPWPMRLLGPRPATTRSAQVLEVLRRTAWMLPCEFGLILLLTAVGINAGNAGSEEIGEMLDGGPLYFLWLGVVVAPCIEEAMFRLVPSYSSDLVLRRKGGGRWTLGVLTSAAFAFAHNLSGEGGEDLIRLTEHVHLYRSIPASQFVFGLLLWDFMRRYGVWACTLSHMLHNFIFLSLAYLEAGAP